MGLLGSATITVYLYVAMATAGHVIQKYCSPASNHLPVESIKRYGRQVLEALAFLLDRGYVMGKTLTQHCFRTQQHVVSLQAMSMLGMCCWTNLSSHASESWPV